jgi:hypothetical protein
MFQLHYSALFANLTQYFFGLTGTYQTIWISCIREGMNCINRKTMFAMQKQILCMALWGLVIAVLPLGVAHGQSNRIEVNGQEAFLSGMNLAWGNFASDLTAFQEPTFQKALDEISSAGGNCMRWWTHVNGTRSPQFTDGKVSGLAPGEIDHMRRVLDMALERNMTIILCLWSFDMLQGRQGVNYEQNRNLLEDPEYTKAYIENALLPMVRDLKGHPAILCWEIFNEPEGMTGEFGWTPAEERTTMKYVQQFINLAAGAIHKEAPKEKVSNGSWSFRASSDIGEYINYYTDQALIQAGGDPLGTLDFYMVHYYAWGKEELSPFHHPAVYWELDKPLVIAEFSAKGPYEGVDNVEAYQNLYDNGYAGALSWTWTGHDGNGGIEEATPGMKFLLEHHPGDVKLNLK